MSRVWPASKYPRSYSEYVKTSPLPESHMQDRLLDLYFTYVHPMFPVLHKSRFLAQYHLRFVLPPSDQLIALTRGLGNRSMSALSLSSTSHYTDEQQPEYSVYVATPKPIPSSRVLSGGHAIVTILYLCDHGSILS